MRHGSIRRIRSLLETVLPEQIKRLQGRFPQREPEQLKRSQEAWDRLARGISQLNAAGVKIGVGTDGGGQQGDQFIGWTMHAELENMVMAGIPPAQVLVAATRTSAEILGLDDLGNGRRRQERRLRRPRREPARRHHEHEEDLERVSARSSRRSRKAASEFRRSSVTTGHFERPSPISPVVPSGHSQLLD